MQPKYIYKIYDITDTFVKVLDDVISKPEFTYSLNGGLGELVLQLNRSLDDYGEGTDLDFNYKVEVHLTDDYNDSALIYTGYISAFNPYYRNGSEGVEITILPNIAKLNNEYYRSGTSVKDNFDLTWTATEIGDIIEGIIDNHRSLVSALYISNDYTDIDDTGNSITVTFSQEKHIDTIHLLEKYIDTGWHWYIDASGKFYLKDQSATADHSFILGKHIIGIDGHKNIEDVMNTYFIWNGEKSGTVVDNIYQDATSQNNFDNIAGLLVDSEMTTDGFSDFTGNAKIANNKDSKRLITITISAKDYDIAGIRPGDTCKILNIDGNQTIFGTNMKIYRIEYTPTEVILELIGVDLKPVLSTVSKSNDVKSVGGVTAQMVREATIKANAGMHWDGDVLVIEGSIKAVTGEIGGWIIAADTLSSVDGDIVLDSSTAAASLKFIDTNSYVRVKIDKDSITFRSPDNVLVGFFSGIIEGADKALAINASNFWIKALDGEDGTLTILTFDGAGNYLGPTGFQATQAGNLIITASGGDITLAGDSVLPATTGGEALGNSTYKWKELHLEQLAAGYPTTEGAVFTKDDHHIYYRNNTAEVRLDTTDPAGTYLPLAGGTMAGSIDMDNTYFIQNLPTPINDGDAANKKYIDDNFLELSGGSLEGTLNTYNVYPVTTDTYYLGSALKAFAGVYVSGNVFCETPTLDGHAATKGYVDGLLGDYLPLAGGTMSGVINMNSQSISNVNYIYDTSAGIAFEISSSSTIIETWKHIVPHSDSTYDLGTTGLRYSHLYVDQIECLLDIKGEANLQLTKAGAIVAVKDAGGTIRYLTCVEDPDHAGHYILYV